MERSIRRVLGGVFLASLVTLLAFSGAVQGAAKTHPGLVKLTYQGNTITTVGSLVDGTTMVPLAPLCADLGFTVSKMPVSQRYSVVTGDHKAELGSDSAVFVFGGHEVLYPNVQTPFMQGDDLMVPLRFLVENMGCRVVWEGGAENSVHIMPIAANDLVLGTVRERLETRTLSLDVQYPKIAGLAPEIVDLLNSFFADRVEAPKQDAYEAEKALLIESMPAGFQRWPVQLNVNYSIRYNQKGLLSLTFDDYLYQGGAHGGTVRTGYTCFVKDGKQLGLKDLFAPGTDYIALLSDFVADEIEAQELAPLSPFTEIREDQDFYVNDDCLVLFFQQYELMAYAYGFPEFRIPLSLIDDALAQSFLALVLPSCSTPHGFLLEDL